MPTPRQILIVDDDVNVANTLKDLLSIFSFEVTVCYDSTAAVDIAAQCNPDVAFIDIGMPRVDGFQVISGLRSDPRTHHIRAVAHSAWGDADTVSKAIKSGFDEHVTKPISLERLLQLASYDYWAQKP